MLNLYDWFIRNKGVCALRDTLCINAGAGKGGETRVDSVWRALIESEPKESWSGVTLVEKLESSHERLNSSLPQLLVNV